MFRIFSESASLIIDVGTADEIDPEIRLLLPGRYQFDEIPLKPFWSGLKARRWGVGIKRDDGSVVIEPD
jgi:hypothetical protein